MLFNILNVNYKVHHMLYRDVTNYITNHDIYQMRTVHALDMLTSVISLSVVFLNFVAGCIIPTDQALYFKPLQTFAGGCGSTVASFDSSGIECFFGLFSSASVFSIALSTWSSFSVFTLMSIAVVSLSISILSIR